MTATETWLCVLSIVVLALCVLAAMQARQKRSEDAEAKRALAEFEAQRNAMLRGMGTIHVPCPPGTLALWIPPGVRVGQHFTSNVTDGDGVRWSVKATRVEAFDRGGTA